MASLPDPYDWRPTHGDLDVQVRMLHRQTGDLHLALARAMDERAAAQRREELTRRAQVQAEAAVDRVRRVLYALETDPPATPTAWDVIREVRIALDGAAASDG